MKHFKILAGTVLAATLVCTKATGAIVNIASRAEKSAIQSTFDTEIDNAAKTEKAAKIAAFNGKDLAKNAKSAYLTETTSGCAVYEKEATKRLPIASMCKIMTLILCFDAVKDGRVCMDESVKVSEKAAGMGGSQVFLEANGEYEARELMKSIAVCSANDSCVAMAERVAGSEDAFVSAMNERAKSLGMENTLFANCTGLPKDTQYSCAKDVAIMLGELLKNEEYFEFCRVWTEKFEHPKGRTTEITNTNRLIRFYQGCDGGKTGFTNEAGFCLAATAKRGGMRLISVVIGEDSGKNRFSDICEMFDYAFSAFALKTVADEHNPLLQKVRVHGGKEEEISVKCERSSSIFAPKEEKSEVKIETILPEYISAPIKSGTKIGELVVYKEGVEIDRVPLLSAESVEKATFFDRLKDVAESWKN